MITEMNESYKISKIKYLEAKKKFLATLPT